MKTIIRNFINVLTRFKVALFLPSVNLFSQHDINTYTQEFFIS